MSDMRRRILPAKMEAEYMAAPDWIVNVAFADALEWAATYADNEHEMVNREWLLDQARSYYHASALEWEDEE